MLKTGYQMPFAKANDSIMAAIPGGRAGEALPKKACHAGLHFW